MTKLNSLHGSMYDTGAVGKVLKSGAEVATRIGHIYGIAFPDGAIEVNAACTTSDAALAEGVVSSSLRRPEGIPDSGNGERVLLAICNVTGRRDGTDYREREYIDTMLLKPNLA